MPFLMSFALEHEIVTLTWIDNASVQFPLNIYAIKGLKLNAEKENRRWKTMDDDAFRFGTLTRRVKGSLRVSCFLSASMVVYLRFDCRF
jgi:hypothetical protein